MQVTKLNESFSSISGDKKIIKKIFDFLKVERSGARFDPLVKAGFKSPYDYFGVLTNSSDLIVMNGHLDFLYSFGLQRHATPSDFTQEHVQVFLDKIQNVLPFEPYDYQIHAFKECVFNGKQIAKMCTSSGKSLTISLLAEFFRQNGKKGLLLVPNINLLTQFKNDILDYNLVDLHQNTHLIGGGNSEKHFNNVLTISTWQSLQDAKNINIDELDYIIVDECHRFASEVTSSIVKQTINCEYKFGFTGTLPEDPSMKMELFGLFGTPKTYITSKTLIDRGLATPIRINAIHLNYNYNDKKNFKERKTYLEQLKFIKDHDKRSEIIVDLGTRLRNKGNTLILFQHTEFGKMLFINIMKKLYTDVQVQNKDITGKKSFDYQEQYGVYFLNGEDDSKIREQTRQVLEHHNDAILISNYSILSTGVNIKKLHNMVLSSPLKAYTTVTQSIGRGMRLHESKKEFVVYDLVDNFPVFKKQYKHRLNTSYNPEEYPIKDFEINLF